MKKNNNKHKAFTFAELMVIMTILTILLAAFSPIFTARYINAGSENVWRFVTLDNNGNAYSDVVNKAVPAASYIGIIPTADDAINSSKTQLGKIVIRPSDKLKEVQPQIDLRFQEKGN